MTKPSYEALEQRILALESQLRRYGETRPRTRIDSSFRDQETKISKRTSALLRTNAALQREIEKRKRAQTELRRSESNFRKLADFAPIGIAILGADRFLYVNSVVETFTGYSRKELLSLDPIEIAHPDIRAQALERNRRRLQGEPAPERYTMKHRTKHGATRWGDFMATVIDFDGVPAILAVVNDITAQRELEARQKTSEQRLNQIIDFLPDATFVVDREGRVVAWNKAIERLTGIGADRMLGCGDYGYAVPFYGRPRPMLIDLVRKPHPAVESEYVSLKRVGETLTSVSFHPDLKPGGVFLAATASLLYDTEGQVAGAIECLRDITAQKRAEEALRASEERYRRFVELSLEGIWRVDFDTPIPTDLPPDEQVRCIQKRGYLAECNDAYARFYGYSSHETMIGKRLIDFYGDAPSEQNFEATLTLVRSGYRAGDRETVEFDREGKPLYFSNNAIGIVEGGFLVAIWGSQRDITHQKRARLALAAEKERLSVTLHSIADAVITTDREGVITLLNPVAEKLSGWRESDAIGRPLPEVLNIIDAATRRPSENPVQQVLAGDRIAELNHQALLVSRDGREYIIAESGAPIRDSRQDIIGVVMVFRDITASQRMETEMLKAEKLRSLGVLAGGIAHDFNNFLTGIAGNLSLVRLDLDPGDPIHSRLEAMEKAALRARNLTQQLLTFSKGGEPDKRTTRISNLVREAAGFALRGSSIRVRFDLPPDLHTVEVDEGQMTQVIHNLMINAAQAMPEGGEVVISGDNVTLAPENHLTLAPGGYIRLSVQDEGTGIPPEDLKKVFDPYFTTKQKGSGLGMAVAYSIIDKHAGQISVYSEMGIGTTVQIYLPASRGKETQRPVPAD
ncbi:MAG: PAS domain S-box protein, partial [Desulfosarcina sp.]|nr:PAS domain S-box protein [Desulfobacterales bacterium]